MWPHTSLACPPNDSITEKPTALWVTTHNLQLDSLQGPFLPATVSGCYNLGGGACGFCNFYELPESCQFAPWVLWPPLLLPVPGENVQIRWKQMYKKELALIAAYMSRTARWGIVYSVLYVGASIYVFQRGLLKSYPLIPMNTTYSGSEAFENVVITRCCGLGWCPYKKRGNLGTGIDKRRKKKGLWCQR